MRLPLILITAYVVLFPSSAHAYIDPGSGSAIMSVIIGFFVAVGLVLKTFWYRIKSVFTGGSAKKDATTTDAKQD